MKVLRPPLSLRCARLAACLLAALTLLPPVEARTGDGPPSRALLLELTGTPRLAGTSGSLNGAKIVARHLRAAGFEVEIDEREVLLSLPRSLELAVYADKLAELPFHERIDRFDPDAIPPGDVPPFNAWTASGRVRGAVVDVGYGLRPDFDRLKAAGVDLRGKIALARYGRAYRGVKVDLATEYGCAAVLLFSDPEDDGAAKGDTWPAGPWKPGWAVQRGSILPMGRAPGDPSSPGFASPAPGATPAPGAPGAQRISGAELAAALPTIPCLPIGAREARDIREQLGVRRIANDEGTVEPRRVGPGPVEVSLFIDAPRELRVIRNVIGRLPGARPGTILCGNHRDAWVRGAHDAGSGTVGLLRAAQRLGERVRGGWRPEHSILLAFWDAEEAGLIGSTEWAEAHADWVRENALAYVNADALVSGTVVGVSGTPGLEAIVAEALERVPDPDAEPGSGGTLLDQWRASENGLPRLSLPGSGSDFAVFLHHLNVPVLDIGFHGNQGGQYHTSFDDFLQVDRYLDPGFVGHELAARFLTELLVAFADLGPLSFSDSWAAHEMERHTRGAADWLGEERADRLGAAFESLGLAVEVSWSQWRRFNELAGVPGEPGGHGEFGDWPIVLESARQARERALLLEAVYAADTPRDFYASLANEEGLAGREWFRNELWTPALELGYGAETFPALRAAAAEGEAELDPACASLIERIDALRERWERRTEALMTRVR